MDNFSAKAQGPQLITNHVENMTTLFAGISPEQAQHIMQIPNIAIALNAIEQDPKNRQNWDQLITALAQPDGMPASVIAHAEKWAGEYFPGYVADFRQADCGTHHHTL